MRAGLWKSWAPQRMKSAPRIASTRSRIAGCRASAIHIDAISSGMGSPCPPYRFVGQWGATGISTGGSAAQVTASVRSTRSCSAAVAPGLSCARGTTRPSSAYALSSSGVNVGVGPLMLSAKPASSVTSTDSVVAVGAAAAAGSPRCRATDASILPPPRSCCL